MSSNKDSERTDSPPLFNYLREEIPLEDIRDYASPQRIVSIDAVKGFAIIFIILAHTSGAWLDKDWLYINGMVYAVLDILGPSLFIFLSISFLSWSVMIGILVLGSVLGWCGSLFTLHKFLRTY